MDKNKPNHLGSGLSRWTDAIRLQRSIIPALVIILSLLVLIFSVSTDNFLTLENLKTIANNIAVKGIMAIGLTFVFLVGGLDLSIGSQLGFTVICSLMFSNLGLPFIVVVPLSLGIGALLGYINGLLTTKVGINPVITTLGMMAVARGAASWFALEVEFLKVGRIYDERFLGFARGYITGANPIIPYSLVYAIILFFIAAYVLNHTRYGRNVFAVGSNPYAAKLAGIDIDAIRRSAYIICGISSALAGIILLSQLGLARDDAGTGFELEVITICVLGGISLSGGEGRLSGVVLAVLIMAVIRNGMVHMESVYGISYFWREVAKGLVLIIAIVIDSYRRKGLEDKLVVLQ